MEGNSSAYVAEAPLANILLVVKRICRQLHRVNLSESASDSPTGSNSSKDSQPELSSTEFYMLLLMSLAAVNVITNLACIGVVQKLLSRCFISGLLVFLSVAEVAFNASQLIYQLLIWWYGVRQNMFSSIAGGVAVGWTFWSAMLASQAFLMLRNWAVVLISCARFERLYFPYRPVKYATKQRLTAAIVVLLLLCTGCSLNKAMRYNLVICSDLLTVSQEATWLYGSSVRRSLFIMMSYVMSTLGPVILVTALNGLIICALIRQRRRLLRHQQQNSTAAVATERVRRQAATAGTSGGGGSAVNKSVDRLLVLLVSSFVLCELPAFASGLLDGTLSAGATHHLIHVAHLATALDSTLNVVFYVLSQKPGQLAGCLQRARNGGGGGGGGGAQQRAASRVVACNSPKEAESIPLRDG